VIITYYWLIIKNSPEDTEENYENPQSGEPVTHFGFQASVFRGKTQFYIKI
jgi:hypothetical protein